MFLLLASEDYTPTTQTLTFDPENIRRTVVFDITDDNVDEEIEQFIASLSFASSPVNGVQLQPNMTAILIEDNDGKKSMHANSDGILKIQFTLQELS